MGEKPEQPYYIFKICILGQAAVGKTCIARRLCFDTFDMNTKATIGIDFYTYNLPVIVEGQEKFVRLSIWDFGGQEQFKKMFNYYINGANGIFMVFSLIDLQTLLGLEWWYEQLTEFSQKSTPKLLVGSKNDLVSRKNKIDNLVIQQLMKRQDVDKYFRTSSKNNKNIKKVFAELTKKILDDHNLRYDKIPVK